MLPALFSANDFASYFMEKREPIKRLAQPLTTTGPEQEWVAISFSREESPRGVQIQEALVIGHIAGKIQTSLAVGPTSPHPCCFLLSREKKSSHILLHSQIRKQYHPNDVFKKMKTIFPSDQHCYLRHFLFP